MTVILLEKAVPEPYVFVVKAVLVVLQLQTFAAWFFPIAMNHVLMCLLSDQFRLLNNEFDVTQHA